MPRTPQWRSCAVGPVQGVGDEGRKDSLRTSHGQEIGTDTKSLQKKTYNTRDSLVVTDPTTDLALISLCSGGRGVKKQGVSGSKNGRLFASVSAVRFKETAKPAAPQDRSDKCGTAANRALPSGTTPPSGSRGNDELRTPCAIRSARCYWEYGCQSPSTHRRRARPHGPPPKLIPGTVRVAGRRKHGMKNPIMREQVFGIGDDHWVTFESDSKSFVRPESPMPHMTPLTCSAASLEMVSRTPAPS